MLDVGSLFCACEMLGVEMGHVEGMFDCESENPKPEPEEEAQSYSEEPMLDPACVMPLRLFRRFGMSHLHTELLLLLLLLLWCRPGLGCWCWCYGCSV